MSNQPPVFLHCCLSRYRHLVSVTLLVSGGNFDKSWPYLDGMGDWVKKKH